MLSVLSVAQAPALCQLVLRLMHKAGLVPSAEDYAVCMRGGMFLTCCTEVTLDLLQQFLEEGGQAGQPAPVSEALVSEVILSGTPSSPPLLLCPALALSYPPYPTSLPSAAYLPLLTPSGLGYFGRWGRHSLRANSCLQVPFPLSVAVGGGAVLVSVMGGRLEESE